MLVACILAVSSLRQRVLFTRAYFVWSRISVLHVLSSTRACSPVHVSARPNPLRDVGASRVQRNRARRLLEGQVSSAGAFTRDERFGGGQVARFFRKDISSSGSAVFWGVKSEEIPVESGLGRAVWMSSIIQDLLDLDSFTGRRGVEKL